MKVNKFHLKVEALGLDTVLENRRGIMVLPKNCSPYILFVDNDVGRMKQFIRDTLLKPILTIAESLARW